MRTSDALQLWHDVNLALVRDGEADLSARQTAILLTITAGDATAQVSDQVRGAPPIVLLAVIVAATFTPLPARAWPDTR